MTDLRQGVSDAAHDALDRLEQLRDTPCAASDPRTRHYFEITEASKKIAQAKRTAQDGLARRFAVEAAAHLLRFAEQQDAVLNRLTRKQPQ